MIILPCFNREPPATAEIFWVLVREGKMPRSQCWRTLHFLGEADMQASSYCQGCGIHVVNGSSRGAMNPPQGVQRIREWAWRVGRILFETKSCCGSRQGSAWGKVLGCMCHWEDRGTGHFWTLAQGPRKGRPSPPAKVGGRG